MIDAKAKWREKKKKDIDSFLQTILKEKRVKTQTVSILPYTWLSIISVKHSDIAVINTMN